MITPATNNTAAATARAAAIGAALAGALIAATIAAAHCPTPPLDAAREITGGAVAGALFGVAFALSRQFDGLNK